MTRWSEAEFQEFLRHTQENPHMDHRAGLDEYLRPKEKKGDSIWHVAGIDPGGSGGGIAILGAGGEVYLYKMQGLSPHDFADIMKSHRVARAWVEKVSARPGGWQDLFQCPACERKVRLICSNCEAVVGLRRAQGVTSTFNFGQNFGGILWALAALEISTEQILPRDWLRIVGVPGKKKKENQTQWKNRLKARAQELYPKASGITLKTSDALLIAEACRRSLRGLGQ